MTYSLTDYTNQLLALLPQGAAWPRDEDGQLYGLMKGLAEELVRIDERAAGLLLESLPSTVSETLAQWEEDYGLPDSCSGATQTENERKLALVQKYKLYGSQSRTFLISLAEALGVTAGITEYQERGFGDDYGSYYYGTQYNFVIQFDISLPEMSEVDEQSLKTLLECTLRKIVHAHKYLVFEYGVPYGALMDGDVLLVDGGTYLVDTAGSIYGAA